MVIPSQSHSKAFFLPLISFRGELHKSRPDNRTDKYVKPCGEKTHTLPSWIASRHQCFPNALSAFHRRVVFSQCSVHCFSLLPSSRPFDLPGPQYRLEKQSEPNVAVDLESTLESQSAWEFCLVRENSTLASSLRVRFCPLHMLTSPVSGNAQWPGLPRQI